MGGESGTGVAVLAGLATTLLNVDRARRATLAVEVISHRVWHKADTVETPT